MRILAIETSAMHGSVALVNDGEVVVSQELSAELRSAQALAPAIHQLLSDAKLSPADLNGVAVGVGPGSFTGLRVGIATAKTFAWALQLPVAGVGTLRSIAAQATSQLSEIDPQKVWRIAAASNAYRKQIFSGAFEVSIDGDCQPIDVPTTVALEHCESHWPDDAWLTGPALKMLSSDRLASLSDRLIRPEFWEPTAASIGRLGWQSFQTGEVTEPHRLLPDYGRVSAAEENA